jgi:hypothetical protein
MIYELSDEVGDTRYEIRDVRYEIRDVRYEIQRWEMRDTQLIWECNVLAMICL